MFSRLDAIVDLMVEVVAGGGCGREWRVHEDGTACTTVFLTMSSSDIIANFLGVRSMSHYFVYMQ